MNLDKEEKNTLIRVLSLLQERQDETTKEQRRVTVEGVWVLELDQCTTNVFDPDAWNVEKLDDTIETMLRQSLSGFKANDWVIIAAEATHEAVHRKRDDIIDRLEKISGKHAASSSLSYNELNSIYVSDRIKFNNEMFPVKEEFYGDIKKEKTQWKAF